MPRHEFHLRLSPEAYLDYYRGVVQAVLVTTKTGVALQFPAGLLRRFVTTDGIEGDFVLTTDANNRCGDLQRARR